MISRAGLIIAAALATASAGAANAQQKPEQQPPRPERTEILNFDNWSVTCAEYAGAKRANCSATLRVVQGKSRQVVFAWTIATAGDRKLSSALMTPTGVRVDQGIELRFGKAKPRKVGFTTCDAQRCTGALPIDEAIIKEAAASGQAEATIRAVDGRSIKFTFPVKGVDRAVAHLRKS